MMTENQDVVIAFLSDPATYGSSVSSVERIDTHTACVFLAGDRAYKLKRAVRYDYLDFSTAERRRTLCEAEVVLNRRTAPDLYLGVQPVTRDSEGRLSIGGGGEAVDWVVCMARFDGDALFDRLASRHELRVEWMVELARAVRRLHEAAEPRPSYGGRKGLSWVIDGNLSSLRDAEIFEASAVAEVASRSAAALERVGPLLEDRREGGWVRVCHGDLHLRNIVLIDGRPTLFDAVEFDDRISCVDVFYDLAFLLMDLWRLDLKRHANAVLNEYVTADADRRALAALPLFLSCRAAVRAKTNTTAAGLQTDARQGESLLASARQYLALAVRLLDPVRPRLVAIGGLSGSGKTTVGFALAPELGAVPGALVLRSDVIRKELAGVAPDARLEARWYRPEVSRDVYAAMERRAGEVLAAGHSVIADATFLEPYTRAALPDVAARTGASFHGVWLDAPPDSLVTRVRTRLADAQDASDADEAVVRMQLAQSITAPPGWTRIDAREPPERVAAAAKEALLRT